MDDDAITTEFKPKSRRRDINDVRAERKRELDRLAQRATRERTKNRIAFLEQKLASLESCDRESTISQLTKTIDDLRNDNTRLQGAMMKMRFAINEALDGTEAQTNGRKCACGNKTRCTCLGKTESTSSGTPQPGFGSPDDDVVDLPQDPPVPLQDGILGIWPTTNSMHMSGIEEFLGLQPNTIPPPVYDMAVQGGIMQNPWQQLPASTSPPSLLNFQLPPANSAQGLTIAPDFEKWHVSNGAFIGAMDAVKKHLASNKTLDLHVPFRAGLWGWDSIPEHELNHPVWSALRAVDQKVFGTWTNKAARIAVMYACQTLLQYREVPSKENLDRVPKYLLARPSQQRIQHPAVIDYLVWPGLRDRLVFEHDKYTRTGAFSAAFVKYSHFDWPYSEREIYALNANTGQWEVSKLFLDHVYDYSKWTMKPEFFQLFPEMIHDMNIYEGDEQTAISTDQHWGPAAVV
ncbi:uncharacterized protein HMPREF1541_03705 [Cyphellophora europaea CBS 101466]|uniref:BZIP domain-containing protein n=1 Tax=Cyphellophora europaea (strain CBS 101466) TaxID=1220924 RepID=W2S128_CYPE1|nr:uncharacterized protein HMPREF1541_03705 [Cyphellophora europaea CBS 101466]ETN41768.1 hypothetical protein HMPREF1541_03705 [Cyphellophora europaea CBS 101466]